MKTLSPTLTDVVLQTTLADARPASVPLGTLLRDAMARIGQMLRGDDHETARTAYLASASDPADLERRADDWDRAQAAYRTMPPAL